MSINHSKLRETSDETIAYKYHIYPFICMPHSKTQPKVRPTIQKGINPYTYIFHMAASTSSGFSFLFVCVLIAAAYVLPTYGQLDPDLHQTTCPSALPKIRNILRGVLQLDPRMGAKLLRLHFHDCFVNGCDASILLDNTASFIGEKNVLGNKAVTGYKVIDEIKSTLNRICGNVFSCADILAVAARDSVALLGGPFYNVPLGRRDARTANLSDANTNLPPAFFNFPELLKKFQKKGLNLQDLVVLSGGHSIGGARCVDFFPRIYNETRIDPAFAANARRTCPINGGDENWQPLDPTPLRFDNQYFKNLVNLRGLLHSDQELFRGDGSASDQLVQRYATNPAAFAADFGASMIRMGNIGILTGTKGEIRMNCGRIN